MKLLNNQFGKLIFINLCIVISLFSCTTNSEKKTNPKEKESIDQVVEKEDIATNDTAILIELTEKWNDLLVKQDLDGLKDFYEDEVSTYGTFYSAEQVIKNKERFFEKYSDFNQSIVGEIKIEKIDNEHYKVLFPKEQIIIKTLMM